MQKKLGRVAFKTSRSTDYFTTDELRKTTGQSPWHFTDVVVKELADNALDAAESAGVNPVVDIRATHRMGGWMIQVSDNGPGIPPEVVRGTLDFERRVSDKALYRSPTRGAQGNALKTVVGIPYALANAAKQTESAMPVVVVAQGVVHSIKVSLSMAREVEADYNAEPTNPTRGTSVKLSVPSISPYPQIFDPEYWAKAISLFNPHAFVSLAPVSGGEHADPQHHAPVEIYKPTTTDLKKYVPTDLISPHWYDSSSLLALIGAHIAQAEKGEADDLPLGTFVRTNFKGLSATTKAKQVCSMVPHIKRLSDFKKHREAVPLLLAYMRHATTAPSHKALGRIGREHFEASFRRFYGDLERFDYRSVNGYLPSGLPYVFEIALAEVEYGGGEVFYGVNYSPTFDDPLEDVRFVAPKAYEAEGVDAFLDAGFAHPEYPHDDEPGERPNTVAAVHMITPAPLFKERGKTRLDIGREG